MKIFSYVVPYDIGFAPNPFSGRCSLACCKPDIRKDAEIGDFIVGTSSTVGKCKPKLLYVMRVSETMNFDAYWNDPRFRKKRPNLRGSKKRIFGDNIYHQDPSTGLFLQEDSRHSHLNGSTHKGHLKKDTGTTDKVLISDDFVYWGSMAITIPLKFSDGSENIVKTGQGRKSNFTSAFIKDFENWFNVLPERGVQGRPTAWSKPF